MAHSEKPRRSFSPQLALLRFERFVTQQDVDPWPRAEAVKMGWSELERRQRALIGELKQNQLIEICFGSNTLVNSRSVPQQSLAD